MTGAPDDGTGKRANPATADDRACHSVPLPNELVCSILAYLDLADLRAAAAVGRQFYHAAWRAGLYIQRVCSDVGESFVQADIASWTELVEHALSKDLRLALKVECYWPEYESDTRSYILDVLSIISTSLPVLLALSLAVPDSMFHEACAILQHPAPRLRSFSLELNGYNPNTFISRSTGLFSGYAPCLREAGLGCPVVGPCALPIFANISRLSAHSWEISPATSILLHFPKLKHLYVLCASEDPEIPPPNIDLLGVTLTSLSFKGPREHQNQPRVAQLLLGVRNAIPVLHYCCHDESFMDWRNPVAWPGSTRESISIHLKGPSKSYDLSIFVSPSDHAWRRSYVFTCFDNGTPTVALHEMPGLGTRLEYLRLANGVLDNFLQCNATFPALRRVRVDIADLRAPGLGWSGTPHPLFIGPVTRARGRVCCPALEVLALAAVHPCYDPGPGPERTLTLQLSDVVLLWSALGLAARPALELFEIDVDASSRAALGVQLDVTHLRDIFSSVGSVRTMPCAVFDDAVWDDEAIALGRYTRQSLAR